MSGEVLTALLSCAGTLVGSVGGIIAANRLTTFRLKALEDKVAAHNHLVERMAKAEQKIKSDEFVINEHTRNIEELNRRIVEQ